MTRSIPTRKIRAKHRGKTFLLTKQKVWATPINVEKTIGYFLVCKELTDRQDAAGDSGGNAVYQNHKSR